MNKKRKQVKKIRSEEKKFQHESKGDRGFQNGGSSNQMNPQQENGVMHWWVLSHLGLLKVLHLCIKPK